MHAEVAGGVFYIAAFLPTFPIYGTILDRDEQSAFDKASKGDRVVQISTLDRYQTNPISLLQEICSKEPSKVRVILEDPLIRQLWREGRRRRREVLYHRRPSSRVLNPQTDNFTRARFPNEGQFRDNRKAVVSMR